MQVGQREQKGDALGRHSGPGGPGGSQAAGTCQDQIQEEIDHSGGGHEPEGTAGVAPALQDGADGVVSKDKGGAPAEDGHIAAGVPHSPGRQGHQGEQRAVAEQGGRRQQGGARQRQQEQRGGGLLLFQAVPGAPGPGGEDRPTGGKAHAHRVEEEAQGGGAAHSGQAGLTHEAAHHQQIRHAVKGLEQIGQQEREGESDQAEGDAPPGQIQRIGVHIHRSFLKTGIEAGEGRGYRPSAGNGREKAADRTLSAA